MSRSHTLVESSSTRPKFGPFHLLRLRDAWAKITPQIETIRLPGGHGSIFREPESRHSCCALAKMFG